MAEAIQASDLLILEDIVRSGKWCERVIQRYRVAREVLKRVDSGLSADLFNVVGRMSEQGIAVDRIAVIFGTVPSYIQALLLARHKLIAEVRALVDSRRSLEKLLVVTDARAVSNLKGPLQMIAAQNLIKSRGAQPRKYRY